MSNIFVVVEFAEYPSNITLPVGSVALFRCRHQSTEAVVAWRVNESSATQLDGAVPVTMDNIGNLSIPATPEYDGIEVVCLALFTDGRPQEQTPTVTLTVTG